MCAGVSACSPPHVCVPVRLRVEGLLGSHACASVNFSLRRIEAIETKHRASASACLREPPPPSPVTPKPQYHNMSLGVPGLLSELFNNLDVFFQGEGNPEAASAPWVSNTSWWQAAA